MSRSLQQKIHVGCHQLGLDADARRDLQLVVTGKTSMSDMSDAELKSVLKRLEKEGFKPTSTSKKRYKTAPRGDLRLVHKLWGELGRAGALRDASRAGLNRFIQARFGNVWGSVPADVDMLREWAQINAVIQALKSWGERAEIEFDWSMHQK